MKSSMGILIKSTLLAAVVSIVLAIVVSGTGVSLNLTKSKGVSSVETIELLQEQLNSLAADQDYHRTDYSDMLEEEISRLQDELDTVFKVNTILTIGNERLQGELREANEREDVRLCEIVEESVEPKLTFPEVVEGVIDGVVHIELADGEQASGFVIGPRLIKTARHVTNGQTEFTIRTNDGHVIKATRAISHKGWDTAFIYIDDLTCVVEAAEDISCRKGGHEVELYVLKLGSIKDCELGQEVFSIGSTYGIANFNAVAKGTIQTLDSKLVEHVPELSGYGWSTLFSMTPEGGGGNSGCPVFTMDGKVVGIWVGSRLPSVHYAIPVDVFVDDIEAVMLMFVQDEYQVEKIRDNRMMEMRNQIANFQQQISYLQQDNEDLLDMYEWFLENKEVLEGVESLSQAVENLEKIMKNMMQSVTLREYLNL